MKAVTTQLANSASLRYWRIHRKLLLTYGLSTPNRHHLRTRCPTTFSCVTLGTDPTVWRFLLAVDEDAFRGELAKADDGAIDIDGEGAVG